MHWHSPLRPYASSATSRIIPYIPAGVSSSGTTCAEKQKGPTSLSSAEAFAGAASAWWATSPLGSGAPPSGSPALGSGRRGLRPRSARRALTFSSSLRRSSGMRSSAALSAAALSAAYAASILAACAHKGICIQLAER